MDQKLHAITVLPILAFHHREQNWGLCILDLFASMITLRTYHCKLIGVLKVPNAVDSLIPIMCGYHLTGRAVGVAWTDACWESFAYGEIHLATTDVGLSITSWNDTVFCLNSHAPVGSSV